MSDKGFDNVLGEICFCSEDLSFNNNGKIVTNYPKVCWYAGNKTEEFANQLLEKIQKLQTVEITELFEEINKECKAQ